MTAAGLPELRRPPDGDRDEDRDEARDRQRRRQVELPPGGPFGNVQQRKSTFTQPVTMDDLVGLLATYSRLITATPQDRVAALGRALCAHRAVPARR
jgi:hypothetical protein